MGPILFFGIIFLVLVGLTIWLVSAVRDPFASTAEREASAIAAVFSAAFAIVFLIPLYTSVVDL